MRFAFIARHRHIWPPSWLCDALAVSRSGFHAWLGRPASTREIDDARLVTAIEKSFKDSDRTCGARRVWRDVLEEGLTCGLHRIERVRQENRPPDCFLIFLTAPECNESTAKAAGKAEG